MNNSLSGVVAYMVSTMSFNDSYRNNSIQQLWCKQSAAGLILAFYSAWLFACCWFAFFMYALSVCVCVCECVRERERERESSSPFGGMGLFKIIIINNGQ